MLQILMTKFIMIDILLAYNTIIGWHALNRLRAMVLTYQMMKKLSTRVDIGELRSNSRESHPCYLTVISLLMKA